MKNVLLHASLCALLSAGCLFAEEEKKPVDPPKTETPKADPPKAETPKTDIPKTDPTKADAPKIEFKSDKDMASYALGMNYGMGAKQQFGADIDADAMAGAFGDAIAGKESKLSDEEMGKMFALIQSYVEKKKAGDKTVVMENKAGVSQALGRNVGRRFSPFSAALNADLAAQGFATAAKGDPVAFNIAEHQAQIEKYFKSIQDEMMAKNKEAGVKNQKESDDFMTENKKKEGVIATASGLQYKILKEGKGEIPKPTDRVEVNYEGRFIEGKVFDSTAKHGKPFETDLVHLIPGWIEALKMMPVGSKWQLYVPANLAYGENGQPPDIPANKMLVFDMELLSIKK